MNKERKLLKEYSEIILILAVFSLVRMVVELCLYGTKAPNIPIEGATGQSVRITVIVTSVIAFLLLLPNFYVGIKGMEQAEKPTGKRAHIVWAIILAVLSLIATITAIVDITKGFSVGKLLAVLDMAVDTALFIMYYLTATKIANNK